MGFFIEISKFVNEFAWFFRVSTWGLT